MHQQDLIEVDWKQPDWKDTVLRAALRHSDMVLTSPSAEVREQAEELIREVGLHPDSKSSLPFYWITVFEEFGVDRMYLSYNGPEPCPGGQRPGTPTVPMFAN